MSENLNLGPLRQAIPFSSSIAITVQGLVCGVGSTLVRMTTAGDGNSRLSLDIDGGRLLAMLSAAFGRPVGADDILHHVEAAADQWHRGDKALANFRLIVARLPQLRDHADADRLRLAEYVLDRGVSPDVLLKELGLYSVSPDLQKYREDQPRIPAGHGRESGRWELDAGAVSQTPQPQQDTSIRVAAIRKAVSSEA